MKTLSSIILMFFAFKCYSQDIMPGQTPDEKPYAIEAVRLFIDVLLKDNRAYFENSSKVGMYKDNIFIDFIDIKQGFYPLPSGMTYSLNIIKPTLANSLSKVVCNAVNQSDKKGCEVNIKRLSHQISDDFDGHDYKKSGDTLIIKIKDSGKDALSLMKFNKKGNVENAITYDVDFNGFRIPSGNASYQYNNAGVLIHKDQVRYRDYVNKEISQTIVTDFNTHGDRTSVVRKEYRSNNRGVSTYENLFFYDNGFNLIKKTEKLNDKFGLTYLITYKNDLVEVSYTTSSGAKEYSFVYKLIK